MKLALSDKKIVNTAVVILAAVLLISIIPIILVSFYSRPLADDFGYSHRVYNAVQNGGGLFDVISASFTRVKEIYLNWQGTYSAVFLFTLQPGAFSDKTYFLTSIVLLGSLILSTLFLGNTVIKVLGADQRYGLIGSLLILILDINFVVDKHQAFFWWNGASYYTLFYSFSLVFFSLLIKMFFTDKKKTKSLCLAFSAVLALVIGGGNYSTALMSAVLLFVGLIGVFIYKRKMIPYYLIVFGLLIAGFAISMLAPGNSTRAGSVNGTSPLEAVVLSIMYAFIYIVKWTGLVQIAVFIIIAILALASTKNIEFKFRNPLFVFLFSVLVFATQFTPPIYSMGYMGEGRQVNIYNFSYYLLISFNIIYICGWINQKEKLKSKSRTAKNKVLLGSLILSVCLAFGGCFIYGINNITSVDIFKALYEGTPQQYSREYDERIEQIKSGNTTIKDVETVPDFFDSFNIESDSKYWINVQMAEYFGVDEISLET